MLEDKVVNIVGKDSKEVGIREVNIHIIKLETEVKKLKEEIKEKDLVIKLAVSLVEDGIWESSPDQVFNWCRDCEEKSPNHSKDCKSNNFIKNMKVDM